MMTYLLLGSMSMMFLGCGESPPKETPKSNVEIPKVEKKEVSNMKPALENKVFDPLAGKTRKEICSADGLLLLKWSYEKIQADFTNLCCVKGGLSSDNELCYMDWPFSDVPSCSAYDDMRNEIFARYGRGFTTSKWQKKFGATDWYKIRSDFSTDWISDVANKNVALLLKYKKEKVACME